MTDLCQLEGHTLKWQLAYFGPKVGNFVTFLRYRLQYRFFSKVSAASTLVSLATIDIFC